MQRAYADPGTPGSRTERSERVREPYRWAGGVAQAGGGSRAGAREIRGVQRVGDKMAAMLRRPYVVGIAGGTGSGKTTVADKLASAMPPGRCVTIDHDAYYRDQGHLPPADREAINYDHPSALDSALASLSATVVLPEPVPPAIPTT